MQGDALPSLYHSADTLSLKRQRAFFLALRLNLMFLTGAAVLSLLNISHWWGALLQAIVLLGALSTTVYLMTQRPERTWYAARAVAESVRTLAWRFAMRSEPFDGSDQEARLQFASKLREVTSQNVEVASRLTSAPGAKNVTDGMLELRASPLGQRSTHYENFRIQNQLDWYSSKSRRAERDARTFFGVVCALNASAILFAMLRIRFPEAAYWPTDVLVTLSAAILSWIQAKRFSELAASYNLAANEISLMRDGVVPPRDEREFSLFVSDAENAFSREHTQWVARKDQ